MLVLRGCPGSPLFEFLNYSVTLTCECVETNKDDFSQGDLADMSFMAGDRTTIKCHKVIAVALSPFILEILKCSDTDQIILPDFGVSEISALMNFCYTGK